MQHAPIDDPARYRLQKLGMGNASERGPATLACWVHSSPEPPATYDARLGDIAACALASQLLKTEREPGRVTTQTSKIDFVHLAAAKDQLTTSGPANFPGSFTTIVRPVQKGLAFRSAWSIVSSSDAARMMRG